MDPFSGRLNNQGAQHNLGDSLGGSIVRAGVRQHPQHRQLHRHISESEFEFHTRALPEVCPHHLTLKVYAKMDQSPTALFDNYEQDFQQISSSIRTKLDDEAKNQQGGEFLKFLTNGVNVPLMIGM